MIEDYEDFSESQTKILNRYVSSTTSNVFVLRNLPEVIKGALFSRYSRSSLGLRTLLLKDFILNEETAFAVISGLNAYRQEGDDQEVEDQLTAIKKAQSFYDRILDGYGDDSIGELGGAHLAIENVSMLAAKSLEDSRIGGSPLEKSTRYVYYDQKVKGDFLYYREPILMTSAYRDLYLQTCDRLFETYSKLIGPLTDLMQRKFPKEHDVSQIAYNAAVRAKVCDCLRGLLPASSLTNMGIYGNGRFFETLIQKLNCQSLAEMQDIGRKGYQELSKVIPSFIRRADPTHKHQKSYSEFVEQMNSEIKLFSEKHSGLLGKMEGPAVRLLDFDPESPVKVAAALLFADSQASLHHLQEYCGHLPEEDLIRILEAAAVHRENRRHKSPRALEHAQFTFEIIADYGVFRDLHRHRILTQERQLLTCDLEYFVPEDILKTDMEKEYRQAMEQAKKTYDKIAAELPEEAQYVVPMGYHVHWYFHLNLRALQWICELRSAPAGHPTYRAIAQEMAKQVSNALPQFERFFKFVDYDGYILGRLGAEIRTVEKAQMRSLNGY